MARRRRLIHHEAFRATTATASATPGKTKPGHPNLQAQAFFLLRNKTSS